MFKKIKKFIQTKLFRKKYYRTGNCLGCGRCCKKIYVKHGTSVIKNEKEFAKLKYLHKFYAGLNIIDTDETGLVFACSHLDEITNLCKIHKNRPGICKRYPQEEIFQMGGEICENCGYKLIPITSFAEVFEKISSK